MLQLTKSWLSTPFSLRATKELCESILFSLLCFEFEKWNGVQWYWDAYDLYVFIGTCDSSTISSTATQTYILTSLLIFRTLPTSSHEYSEEPSTCAAQQQTWLRRTAFSRLADGENHWHINVWTTLLWPLAMGENEGSSPGGRACSVVWSGDTVQGCRMLILCSDPKLWTNIHRV